MNFDLALMLTVPSSGESLVLCSELRDHYNNVYTGNHNLASMSPNTSTAKRWCIDSYCHNDCTSGWKEHHLHIPGANELF